jgi:hypothetical protein
MPRLEICREILLTLLRCGGLLLGWGLSNTQGAAGGERCSINRGRKLCFLPVNDGSINRETHQWNDDSCDHEREEN